jgi:flagellar biosynthesis protein FlhG
MRPDERRNFGRVVAEPVPRAELPDHWDQAAALRAPRRTARILAITSGKGGVGKSNLAVNLGIALAQLGARTVLVDLDLGLANADVLLDITPRHNLSALLDGRRQIGDIVARTPYGLNLIAGASGLEKLANLFDEDRGALLRSLEALCTGYDYVLFDTAAGIAKNTVGFLATADEILVVAAPEPTSVVDAFAMIKILARDEERGDIGLVMNMTSSPEEGNRFAHGMCATAYRMLNVYVEHRGNIPADPHVPAAVRMRRPFLSVYPSAPASVAVRALARRIVGTWHAEATAESHRPGFLQRAVRALFGR